MNRQDWEIITKATINAFKEIGLIMAAVILSTVTVGALIMTLFLLIR